MWGLPQYTSGDLAFNNFLRGSSEGGAWASRTVSRIFCKIFYIYLAIRDSQRPIIRSTKLL